MGVPLDSWFGPHPPARSLHKVHERKVYRTDRIVRPSVQQFYRLISIRTDRMQWMVYVGELESTGNKWIVASFRVL